MNRIEYNLQTGEVNIIALTEKEIEQAQASAELWNKKLIEIQSMQKKQEEIKTSALAKLAALGLTQDEVTALIG